MEAKKSAPVAGSCVLFKSRVTMEYERMYYSLQLCCQEKFPLKVQQRRSQFGRVIKYHFK